MYLTARTLLREQPREIDAAILGDAIRAYVDKGDRLESLRIRIDDKQAHVFAVVLAADENTAHDITTGLCLRALSRHPALRGWRMEGTGT
jgi:hypothetical protein